MTKPSLQARRIAHDASFQAFANAYLREVDNGVWRRAGEWQASSHVALTRDETHVVELRLHSQAMTLVLGVSYRSLVGRHTLTAIHRRGPDQPSWQSMDSLSAILLLVDELYAKEPDCDQRFELIARVIESHQLMTQYVGHALSSDAADAERGFIESEQSIVLGHWLHPTPRSRQGMVDWQQAHYSPELNGHFQLHFFAAERSLVQQRSLLDSSAEEMCMRLAYHEADTETRRRLAALTSDHCLLPVHPLQAHWLVHQEHIRPLLAAGRLIDVGRLGPSFTPTSSVRTLYSATAGTMMKLSMPVRITNSLRINLQTELGDSVWVSQLLRTIATEFPALQALEDPAYITVALPGMEETGFEAIFRKNPFAARDQDGRRAHSVAALVQEPFRAGDASVLCRAVRRLAQARRVDLQHASLLWFDAYWKCAVETSIGIYDRYGISLEAHQQNVLIELDDTGLPRGSWYRDVQGIGLSECCRELLLARVPELAQQTKVFEPDDIVRNGFGYYLFFNQLCAVVNRFGLDGLLDEQALLAVVRQKLAELRPHMQKLGGAFIDALRDAPSLPFKGNLLTRVAGMDELEAENELAVYTQAPNPLRAQGLEGSATAQPAVTRSGNTWAASADAELQ